MTEKTRTMKTITTEILITKTKIITATMKKKQQRKPQGQGR